MCGIGALRPAGIDSQSLNARERSEGKVEVEEKAVDPYAFRIFPTSKKNKRIH